MTSKSIAAIVQLLLKEGAQFVLTSHMNQDPLEQLFGYCRHKGGSNENPNVQEACNSINTIRSVSMQALPKKRGNTEPLKFMLDATPLPKRKKLQL